MRDEKFDYGYNRVAATALGIVQLMLGTGSVIVGIICIFQLTSFGFIGHGIWCGTIFIVAGSVVTAAGSRPADCVVITGTTLSLVAMVFSLSQMALSAVGLYYDITQDYCDLSGSCRADPYVYCTRWSTGPQCLDFNGHNVSVILASVLAILALIEFAIALATACLACACCSVKENKVKPSSDASIAVPPSTGRISSLDDSKSYSTARHGVPQEWRLSYVN